MYELRLVHVAELCLDLRGGRAQDSPRLRRAVIDQPARDTAQNLREARRKLVEAEEPQQEVPVMVELPEPRPTYILARGAYDAPKADANRVQRAIFADILIPFPKDVPRNRLGLAKWLTDPRHPLTARVAVNRVWTNFFGRGLVTTPEERLADLMRFTVSAELGQIRAALGVAL